MTPNLPVLVIGDIHGDVDCLNDILNETVYKGPRGTSFSEIVQVGDLGNFVARSESGDRECYMIARDHEFTVLWGNHDAAATKPQITSFAGFVPSFDPRDYVTPKFTVERYGWTITHAGISDHFAEDYLDWSVNDDGYDQNDRLFTAVGWARGGQYPDGGILWRDNDAETLSAQFKQIYGHTPCFIGFRLKRTVEGDIYGYCIDTHPRPEYPVKVLPYLIINPDSTITLPEGA